MTGQSCYEASRHVTVASYEPPTSVHVVIRYLSVSTYVISLSTTSPSSFVHSDSIYHFCRGTEATQHAAFGEAVHLAVSLQMHEEASYEGIDPIECEVRRRAFWLLFLGLYIYPSWNSCDHFANLVSLLMVCSGQIDVSSSRPPHVPA
jgi:hypothetical protein